RLLQSAVGCARRRRRRNYICSIAGLDPTRPNPLKPCLPDAHSRNYLVGNDPQRVSPRCTMRFYLKLLAAVAVFVCGQGASDPQRVADLAFDVHVAYVCRCGSAADFEKLLDQTQRSLAARGGGTDCYEFGKRYQRLRAERVAAAEATHGPLSEAARMQI